MRKRKIREVSDEQLQLILDMHAKFPNMTCAEIISYSQIPVSPGFISCVIKRGSVEAYNEYKATKRVQAKERAAKKKEQAIKNEEPRVEEEEKDSISAAPPIGPTDDQSLLLRICKALESIVWSQKEILREIRMPDSAKNDFVRTTGEQIVNIGMNMGSIKKKFSEYELKSETYMCSMDMWMHEVASGVNMANEGIKKMNELWETPEPETVQGGTTE